MTSRRALLQISAATLATTALAPLARAQEWPKGRQIRAMVPFAAGSTLDIVGGGRFTLLTGIGGGGWRAAAADLATAGFPIRCVTIGPGQDYEDPFGEWARASEIEDAGAILVRPDQFVAWRQRARAADCRAALGEALTKIVGTRGPGL